MLPIFKTVTLTCVFEFKNEVRVFAEKESDLTGFFDSEDWLCQLSDMTDIFNKLNELNLKFFKSLFGKMYLNHIYNIYI